MRGHGGVATAANDLLPPGLSEAAVAGVTGLLRLLRGFHPAPPSAAWALFAAVHLVTDISGHGAFRRRFLSTPTAACAQGITRGHGWWPSPRVATIADRSRVRT